MTLLLVMYKSDFLKVKEVAFSLIACHQDVSIKVARCDQEQTSGAEPAGRMFNQRPDCRVQRRKTIIKTLEPKSLSL